MEPAQEPIGYTYFFVEAVGQIDRDHWVKLNGIASRFWFSYPIGLAPGDRVRITIKKEPDIVLPR